MFIRRLNTALLIILQGKRHNGCHNSGALERTMTFLPVHTSFAVQTDVDFTVSDVHLNAPRSQTPHRQTAEINLQR